MYEVPDPSIDVDLLIKEVKARPCLYDKSHPRYGDPQVRSVAWDEVTAIIYARLWEEYSDEEKAEKMDQILKRWKNLRNCFLRESKRQKDPKWINGCAYKRRKYIYYEAMSFLNSENETEESTLGIDLPESAATKNTKVSETPIPDPKPIPKTSAEVCKSKSVNTKLSTNSVNANVSANSVNPQVSTDPAIAHVSTNSVNPQVSTNPVIAHVVTNPLTAQVSTDRHNEQVSNDSVSAQVSTDSNNPVSWPDLVINIPFDSLIPDNPDTVINNPSNSIRTYNITNFDTNASYNTVIAENVTNFVANTSVDSVSVNNLTNFVTNTSSDYASANDSTNFVTNTSSEYVSASELNNFVANTLSNYASANDAINFLTNTSMNSVSANDSTNFIPNTTSNSVSVENSTNFVNNTSLNPIKTAANNSSKTPNSAADNPGKYVTNISTNSANPVAYTVSNSVMVNVHDSDSTSFALSLVPMLNKLSIDDKVECQIKILSAILPFIRKSKEERKRMTAPPAKQARGQRKEDLVTLEIRSDDSDDDLFLA